MEKQERPDLLGMFAELVADAMIKRQGHAAGNVVMSTGEAAKYLKRSENNVRALVAHGELPAVKNGRRMQFLRADLDAWLERNRA